jgi:hypothetical protein
MKTEAVNELRQVETARLDDLMRPFMLRAMKGEKDAALVVLRIMERRAKLLGLDVEPEENNQQGVIREYVGINVESILHPLAVSSNGRSQAALGEHSS